MDLSRPLRLKFSNHRSWHDNNTKTLYESNHTLLPAARVVWWAGCDSGLSPFVWEENQSDGVSWRSHCRLHWHVRVHLCIWSQGGCRTDGDIHCLVPAVGQGTGLGLRVVQAFLGAVLHSDDAVEGLEAAPQLQVDFTLDVHEDEAACEAYGHHDQFCPEGPLQHTCRNTQGGYKSSCRMCDRSWWWCVQSCAYHLAYSTSEE